MLVRQRYLVKIVETIRMEKEFRVAELGLVRKATLVLKKRWLGETEGEQTRRLS